MREWWHELGSSHRFIPRWWQRRAYVEGLRDAARILDVERWKSRAPDPWTRDALRAIHARSMAFAQKDQA